MKEIARVRPPSKYEPVVMNLARELEAGGVFLLVLGGKMGSGSAAVIAAENVRVFGDALVKLGQELLSDPTKSASGYFREEER